MEIIKSRYSSYIGLIKWSLIRHRYYIPIFIVVQILLSLAMMYGFSFITNAVDEASKSYLCTGAVTINIIAVSCVLAPQIISEAKQNGVFDYQKTLPISRIGIIISDLFIWGIISLPGIAMSVIIGSINFGVYLNFDIVGIMSLIFVITSLILFGFSVAYLLPSNIVALITQLIMIGGLLFSPIIYSADRLPHWMEYIYNYLPFVPVSNIIRYSLFSLNDFNLFSYIVVFVWALIAFVISMYTLTRRK
ncbi:MAG: ABC transporter permease [Peptoanaerobacter stomatis]|uniref:ABC transporter permease n=1 Tax=Peptoanaerobacter stomatis TaxID=796937 RepID=UPI003FA179A5